VRANAQYSAPFLREAEVAAGKSRVTVRVQRADSGATATAAGSAHIAWFEELRSGDVPRVGGKNASLGEMFSALQHRGIRVPAGFATTADAYRAYIESNGLAAPIRSHLDALHRKEISLEEAGSGIRGLFMKGEFPEPIAREIRAAYRELARRSVCEDPPVAVRSSATAEDLPQASFAGQHESFLNVRGESEVASTI
jgi:pyruvate,water dikinase